MISVRFARVARLLALVGFSLAALPLASASARAQALELVVRPPTPCAGDSVLLGVIVPACPPCQFVTGVDLSTRRVDMIVNRDCATLVVCARDTVWFPLGRLAAGNHVSVASTRTIVLQDSLPVDTVVVASSKSFFVSPNCPSSPWPYTSAVEVLENRACDGCAGGPCAGAPFAVRARGTFPNTCWYVKSVEVVPPAAGLTASPPIVRFTLSALANAPCAMVLAPWSATAIVNGLPQGVRGVPVEVRVVPDPGSSPPWPPADSVVALLPLVVGAPCAIARPVYVDSIAFARPVCAGAAVPVSIHGKLPSNCFSLRGVELVPNGETPPIVRVRIGWNDCMGLPCATGTDPFHAEVLLPPMAAGAYALVVQEVVDSWCDSTRVISIAQEATPFTVRDSCGPPPTACLRPIWGAPPYSQACDATIAPGGATTVDLRVASPVALAGLQGVLHHDPPLWIDALEPTGPAAGMKLAWSRTSYGARFVLFADQGAPIPPYATAPDDTAYAFAPVLRVTLSDVAVPSWDVATASVWSDSLLGADAAGHAVPECALDAMPVRAVICRGRGCDHDGNGVTNVCDLVIMAHCVLHTGACGDSTRSRYDCDADGDADLADVLCCANAVLGGGAVDSSVARPEPGVSLRFGEPATEGGTLTLPMTLDGADRIGAARLALRYPSDRYVVTGLQGGGSDWLVLHEETGGRTVVGLVALNPQAAGSTLPLVLTLALRDGQAHGGDVAVAEADASGPDGVGLRTGLAGASRAIGRVPPIALGAGRPNPFSDRVTFSLELARAADVDLGIYDLAGRRVATLVHGRVAAGARAVEWNGRDDSGRAVHEGLYFVRARAEGVEIARKAVLRRSR